MAFPLIAAGVVLAASAIGGAMSASANRQNSKVALQYALANSAAVRKAGQANAAATMMAGAVNAQLALMASKLQAQAAVDTGKVNAEMARATAFFNGSLMETEITKLLEEQGFSELSITRQFAQHKGEVIAGQAASGTTIGEGSNADVVASDMAQFELDKTVLKRNYQQKMGDVLNAVAMNTWQGEMEARKFEYGAGIEAVSALANGQMQAAASAAQAGINAAAISTNANIAAWQGLSQGMHQSNQYSSAARQAMVSGLVNGTAGAISTYGSFGGFAARGAGAAASSGSAGSSLISG